MMYSSTPLNFRWTIPLSVNFINVCIMQYRSVYLDSLRVHKLLTLLQQAILPSHQQTNKIIVYSTLLKNNYDVLSPE